MKTSPKKRQSRNRARFPFSFSSSTKKIKLVVSDFHLGRGARLPNGMQNPLEDFHWDDRWKEFLEFYSSEEYEDAEVELIFNGDMLNLILTDYHGHYTVVITEGVTLIKLKAIIKGHPVFFGALKAFLSHPKRSLTYVVGNHDQEMLWKSARKVFEETAGKEVQWKNTHYQVDGIHIEHGHQYETVNRIDPTKLFLTENLPEPILNLPWGTLFAVQFLLKVKMQRPYFDKVRPFRQLVWWSLFHDTWFTLAASFKVMAYFISTRFTKNRYRHSSLKSTLRILREVSIVPQISDAAKRILRTPEIHTVVFGHTHGYKVMQVAPGKQYINLGTWNETLSLHLANYGVQTKLTYLRVDYHKRDRNSWQPVPLLRHWIGKMPTEADAVGY